MPREILCNIKLHRFMHDGRFQVVSHECNELWKVIDSNTLEAEKSI